ncbi:hypothetical protein GOV11_02640 [Candidatus Woesearchaeota archaeon]|nr:hypothetical protein [Candidatus Woesearchaeota archaeon]
MDVMYVRLGSFPKELNVGFLRETWLMEIQGSKKQFYKRDPRIEINRQILDSEITIDDYLSDMPSDAKCIMDVGPEIGYKGYSILILSEYEIDDVKRYSKAVYPESSYEAIKNIFISEYGKTPEELDEFRELRKR